MHRFGTEKTICDFCHQGKSEIVKSGTLKLLICKRKREKTNERRRFRVQTKFFLRDKNETL